MVAEICNADSTAESLALYSKYHPYITGTQFIFASDSGATPGATINRNFKLTGVVRGLFKSDKIVVLDERTYYGMLAGKAGYTFDQSIALDTMTLSYITPFIEQRSVPEDFVEAFSFIASDDVNVDPLPYMHENVPNLGIKGAPEKIQKRLRGYEILRTLDKNHLAHNGEVRSTLDDKGLDQRTKMMLSRMVRLSKNKKYAATIRYRHGVMACLLFKMVEIQLRYQSQRSVSEKLIELFQFQHDRLSTIFARESLIAKAYFENGTELKFFGKMQKNKNDIFDVLRGMAWDFLHIRHMEENVSIRPETAADYYFPAFLTFDDRLVKLIDLHPLKACAVFGPQKEVMPFYDGDLLGKITEGMTDPAEFTARFFSRPAIAKRHAKRVSDYRIPRVLKKELGDSLANLTQVPYLHEW
jgi:hypothetical protein